MDFELLTFLCNNNTGYLLHAISPKSKEHIACYKHYNKLQIHCCKTLLRNIVTVTQWRIVGSRGPGARNSVGPSATCLNWGSGAPEAPPSGVRGRAP